MEENDIVDNLRSFVPAFAPFVRALRSRAQRTSTDTLFSYNSAVFATESANNYNIFTLNANYVQGPNPPEVTNLTDISGTIQGFVRWSPGQNESDDLQLFSRLQKMAVAGQLDRLENQACVDAYLQPFQSARRNLLMIVEEAPATRVDVCDLYFGGGVGGTCGTTDISRWICAQFNKADIGVRGDCWPPCDDPSLVSRTNAAVNASNWTPFDRKVQYCLSEPASKTCEIHVSLQIMLVVIAMNVVKAAIMFVLAYGAFKSKQPLLTIGDAISSFTRIADPVTENMCLLSKGDVVSNPGLWPATPKEFKRTSHRFHYAISRRRWITCISL